MTAARWPDGCPRDGHLLDGICVLAKVDVEPTPTAAVPWTDCPGCEGAEGWMNGETWTACPRCEGAGGWPT